MSNPTAIRTLIRGAREARARATRARMLLGDTKSYRDWDRAVAARRAVSQAVLNFIENGGDPKTLDQKSRSGRSSSTVEGIIMHHMRARPRQWVSHEELSKRVHTYLSIRDGYRLSSINPALGRLRNNGELQCKLVGPERETYYMYNPGGRSSDWIQA